MKISIEHELPPHQVEELLQILVEIRDLLQDLNAPEDTSEAPSDPVKG